MGIVLVHGSVPRNLTCARTSARSRPEIAKHLPLTTLISREHTLVEFPQYRQKERLGQLMSLCYHGNVLFSLNISQQLLHPAPPTWVRIPFLHAHHMPSLNPPPTMNTVQCQF